MIKKSKLYKIIKIAKTKNSAKEAVTAKNYTKTQKNTKLSILQEQKFCKCTNLPNA
jgi:hypothetical protein